MTKHLGDAPSARHRRSDASANQDEAPPTVRVPDRRPVVERQRPEMRVSVAREDNQQGADGYAHVSLELLALLSPHGTTQQWEDEDDDCGHIDASNDLLEHTKRLSMLARVDLAEYSGMHQKQAPEIPDLTSPSQHMTPFQVSPTNSAHDKELDLASPVALPESPKAQRPLWGVEEADAQDDVTERSALTSAYASPSPQSQRISGRSPNPARTRTPSKGTTKPKARHGGIYSLLLKNKPPEHEAVLVDEKRSPLGPELSPPAHSVNKKASPPSISKLQHGGIYSLLRRNSKDSN